MTREQLTDVEWGCVEPYLAIGEYGLYPARLRKQFEGVIWKCRSGAQWREMPAEFGPWSTVNNGFRQWRDAGVFEALLEGLIAQAATRGSPPATTRPPESYLAGLHLRAAMIWIKDLNQTAD